MTWSRHRWVAPVLVLCFSLAASPGSPAAAADGYATVGPAEVAEWQERGEPFLFVDTRPQQLYRIKHARGAINIPAFAVSHKPLAADSKIVIYDNGAGSTEALRAAAALQSEGHSEFYVLEGGLTAWEAAKLPIVAAPGLSAMPFVEPIGPDELLRLIEDGGKVAVLDVRDPDRYHEGRVPTAASAPAASGVKKSAAGFEPEDLIVLYDDGSGQAQKLAEQLRRQGYRAVKYLHGGMLGWTEKKLRVEK
jgi:rhodanese-related sulfurtransferase